MQDSSYQGLPPSTARPSASSVNLNDLPSELLLQVFTQLAKLGFDGQASDGQPVDPILQRLPFRHPEQMDLSCGPHPGLRAYPFLGQVCRKWDTLLCTPEAQALLWQDLVVDFGHELVTAIHTPLKWSNKRPTPEEFEQALSSNVLSVFKMLAFLNRRKQHVRSLSLANSEGFWADDLEYVALTDKHDFQAGHLGFFLGTLVDHLQELQMHNCTNLISNDTGTWAMLSACHQLRRLRVEGIQHRVTSSAAAHLALLTKLESLTLTGEENGGQWISGLDSIPAAWSSLTQLSSLSLREHKVMDTIPAWLANMPALRSLDVSGCVALNLANITMLTQLTTLSLQRLELTQILVSGEPISEHAKAMLPDLSPMTNLQALCLSGNRMTRVPVFLSKLTRLTALDVRNNMELTVPSSLTPLLHLLPALIVFDLRGIHKEKGDCWGTAKCETMSHLAEAAKLLKRRRFSTRLLLDTQ